MFNHVYRGRRVLVTGHTGFKGSWLTLWLQTLGAEVAGVSLPAATAPDHASLLKLGIDENIGDIRNADWLRETVNRENPEIVFHLAAQALVRRSYRDPLETWSSNVMGTANLLEACRDAPALKAVVIITTDKVYENNEWCWGYRENDRLGGHDPYSASKAAAELVLSSYRKSFFDAKSVLISSARAGNVIGGGDWSEDRLIPDLVRAVTAGQPLRVRSPDSTRPWQHVLECLAGYLQLGQGLLEQKSGHADAWNFGPDVGDNRKVAEILDHLSSIWPAFSWVLEQGPKPHEANLLYLDNAKAKAGLGWRPVWNLDRTLRMTSDWYRSYLESGAIISRSQLEAYVVAAQIAGLAWAAQ